MDREYWGCALSTCQSQKKPTNMKTRSINWCIARLRRLINNSSTQGDSKEAIERKVDKISKKLQDGLSSGNLQVKKKSGIQRVEL